MASAFFLPGTEPDVFESTELTEGPWTAGVQHGGPPAALLTRTVEDLPSTIDGPTQIARLTVEILGPVPVAPVRVAAEVVRPGRAVELVEATLTAGDRPVVRARAWRIRTTSLPLPPAVVDPGTPLPGLPIEDSVLGQRALRRGYLGAVAWRFVDGHFDSVGPARVWTRLRVPLVDGEKPTGLQRAVAVADSGNGLSRLLEFSDWWFINTELSVHVYREPVGEWVFVEARTRLDPGGLGLADTTLGDEQGTFGAGAQALMVGQRG
jgi:hypothetical protein